jgi:hypothetical protein
MPRQSSHSDNSVLSELATLLHEIGLERPGARPLLLSMSRAYKARAASGPSSPRPRA